MRICIVTVTTHGIGGMQDHTRALAKGLAEVGHDVEVVTTRHPEGLIGEERDGVRWHYVDAGHSHPRLPRRDPAWLPASYDVFLCRHRDRPFDVVHSESTSAIGLVRRGVHRRVPVVPKFQGNTIALSRAALARARGGDFRTRLREAKTLLWTLGEWSQYGQWHRFRSCVWIVPTRREFEDTRRTAFLDPSLGHVVPNGIDASVFRPRPQAEARADLDLGSGDLFVSVGRLNAEKGFQHAIRALAQLEEPTARSRLVIVGDGEYRGRLETLARSLGVASRVLFVGAQPHEVVAKYLAATDVFLFPTERAESAGIVLYQAMACGRPVIASDVGGITEVVRSTGQYGLLIPPGDVPALTECMRSLMRDEARRRRLGEAARRRVLAGYTAEHMVEQTLDVYRIAISRLARGSDVRR